MIYFESEKNLDSSDIIGLNDGNISTSSRMYKHQCRRGRVGERHLRDHSYSLETLGGLRKWAWEEEEGEERGWEEQRTCPKTKAEIPDEVYKFQA